jgi:hypothetical protein
MAPHLKPIALYPLSSSKSTNIAITSLSLAGGDSTLSQSISGQAL